jgi:hypothetical protein
MTALGREVVAAEAVRLREVVMSATRLDLFKEPGTP